MTYPFEHLVIDAWNAIHASGELLNLLKTSQEAARARLAEIVAPIHDFGGVRVTLVYDGKGENISIVRPSGFLSFSEVFTPSVLSADELIEQLCANSKNPREIMVVTRDNMIRLTASSFGSFAMTPTELFDMASRARNNLLGSTRQNNLRNEREWKTNSAFSALDSLSLELNEIVSRPLLSKRLKKKLKRAGKGDLDVDSSTQSSENSNPKNSKVKKKIVLSFEDLGKLVSPNSSRKKQVSSSNFVELISKSDSQLPTKTKEKEQKKNLPKPTKKKTKTSSTKSKSSDKLKVSIEELKLKWRI